MITGACGYIISRPHTIDWRELGLGLLALYAAVSGCTVLNMVFDSDVDAAMSRTAQRALPRGIVKMLEAVLFGAMLSYFGLWLAWSLRPVFGMVVVAGLLIYEHSLVKPDDLSKVNVAFFNVNGYISITIFVATLLALSV